MTPGARECAAWALRTARARGHRGLRALNEATDLASMMVAETLRDRASAPLALEYADAYRHLRAFRRKAMLHRLTRGAR